MSPEDLELLKAMAADRKADRTPEQAMGEQMADHYGDAIWRTSERLRPEFAADGWTITSVSFDASGNANVELMWTDIHDARVAGLGR